MRLMTSGRLAFSALTLSVLAACGGGGDSGNANPQNQLPADGQVVVISGTSATPAGTYTVPSGSGASGTYAVGGDLVEYASGSDTSNKFDVSIAFQRGNPANYAVIFEDASDDYLCSGGTLSPAQIAAINAAFGTTLTKVATCPAGLTIDANAHRAQAINFKVPNAAGGKSVTVSANIAWVLK